MNISTYSATINGFIKFWDLLNNISLIWWLITLVFSSSLIYFFRFLKFQFKYARNLKKQIYLLKTHSTKSLQNEKDQLTNISLFSINSDIKDITKGIKILQNLNDKCVYIVGYYKGYKHYQKLFEFAENKNIPIIIYAKQGEIKTNKHWKLINDYIYCDVANSSNRLVIIVLNILMVSR